MRLKAQQWEVEAALVLSEVAYGVQPNSNDKALFKFQSRFSVHGQVCFFCTKSGQKYVICVCQRGDLRVLFCCFAGTHLPGDWEETNIHLFHETNATEVGAPGHAGFLKRAVEVPLEGIERIARDARASRIVLCGHSLGGAVAHFCLVRWLFALSSDSYNKDTVLSIAVGAPFFGGLDMLEHIKRHGWLDCFLTVVNGNDPVPRVMNLAASLVEATISCAFATLFSACVVFLTQPEQLKTVTETGNLFSEIEKASHQDFTYLTSYLPIGRYLIFSVDGQVFVHDDTDFLSGLLGPVQLLRERQDHSFIQGFLDSNALAHHDIKAYQSIAEANESSLSEMCAKSVTVMRHSSSSSDDERFLSAANLAPVVHEISCETFTSHERQLCRIMKICGCNLDFIGKHSVEIDVENVDHQWSTGMVSESRISRRSTSDLVIEQVVKRDDDQEGDENGPKTVPSVRSKPYHDLRISLRSDVVVDGGGPSTTDPTLPRANCHSALDMPEDSLSFYSGQFFLDTQQHAWIMKELFSDYGLHQKLIEFRKLVDELKCVSSTDFLQMQPDWSALEDVGKPIKPENPANYRRLRDELYDWIVPPNGLVVRTKLQSVTSVGVFLVSLALGGGIIYAGGFGIIGGLLGYGTSLSGGYGTATLVGLGGSSAAYFLSQSRLRTKYYVMLEDLVKTYTGLIPKTMTEMELEEILASAEADFATDLATGHVKREAIPLFDEYDTESQQRFTDRVRVIRLIHEIKKERTKGTVVAICGPRDSGKTTLVSQLLHKPDLALATGLRGGQGETRSVTPYSMFGVPGYILLDTPGLTGPEDGIKGKFEAAALNLSSTFVYVREYEGLPTEVDLLTLKRILESAARSQDPKILVCLNRCQLKLTEDATGEIFHLTAENEKKEWLARLEQLRFNSSVKIPTWMNQLLSRSNLMVEFVELKGDRALEVKLSNDVRTKGIWTASSIGEWISNTLSPAEGEGKERWAKFASHMEGFSYIEWQTRVRACRKAQQDEADRLQAALNTTA